MLFFPNDKDYKNVVSGLRRELKTFGVTTVSHNQMLELLAKSRGHTSYAALLAAQPPEAQPAPAVTAPPARKPYKAFAYAEERTYLAEMEKYKAYRLFNTGQLDLCEDEDAVPVHGLTMAKVAGTLDDIWNCLANTNAATRQKDGSLDIQYSGDTDVNWDDQETRRDTRGVALWQDGDCETVPEDSLVLVPEGCEDLNLLSEEALENEGIDLEPREELIDACFRWLKDNELVQAAVAELVWDESWGGFEDGFAEFADAIGAPGNKKASTLGKAQWVVGFAMHVHEFKQLRERLLALLKI